MRTIALKSLIFDAGQTKTARRIRGKNATEPMRLYAFAAMSQSNGNLKKASEAYNAWSAKQGYPKMLRVRRFLTKWHKRYLETGTVQAIKPKGRTRIVKASDAKRASEILAAGSEKEKSGKQQHFGTLREGLQESEELRQIRNRYKVSDLTFMRAMQAQNPKLKQRVQETVQPYPEQVKIDRLKAAKFLKRQPKHFFKRILWIDAAKVYCRIDNKRKVWVDITTTPHPPVLFDKKAAGKRCKTFVLAYYAAVNSELGPVHICLTSGCQGFKANANDKQYMVRSYISSLKH